MHALLIREVHADGLRPSAIAGSEGYQQQRAFLKAPQNKSLSSAEDRIAVLDQRFIVGQ